MLKLTISQLHRHGFLKPGEHEAVVGWPNKTDQMRLGTSIGGPDGDFANLAYTTQSGVEFDLWIRIESTSPSFGGAQKWFICPTCKPERRVGILFFNGEHFVCRLCRDVTYTSKRNPFYGITVSCLDVDSPYSSYRGQLTRRGKRLARKQKKAWVLVDKFLLMEQRHSKRFEKWKKFSEQKLKKIEQRTNDRKKEL